MNLKRIVLVTVVSVIALSGLVAGVLMYMKTQEPLYLGLCSLPLLVFLIGKSRRGFDSGHIADYQPMYKLPADDAPAAEKKETAVSEAVTDQN